MAGTNPGPVRGTLKFDSTVTGDEADDKYRLAMHILAKMDVVKNTQQDTDDKDWVNTVDSYKNYVADWKNNGIIDGNDLSSLCSTGDYTNSDVVNKPWLPTIASNQTTISATQDTKITLTFTNDVTGGEANDFDIIDSGGDVVTNAVKGFALDSKKVILTLENDVDWSTGNNTYKVKHTMNKGVSGAPALSFANGDPIYDFEASDFTLTDALAPTVAITKTVGVEGGGDKIKDVPNIVFTFNRDGSNFTKDDINVNPVIANFDNATLTINADNDKATLTGIPAALTDGTEYTFSVAADAFQSVSGVNNTASNDLKFTFDTTAPTIVSAVIDTTGKIVTLTMSEDVVLSAAAVDDHKADFTIAGQNPTKLERGTGENTLVFTLLTAITKNVISINVVYAAGAETIKDGAGNSLANVNPKTLTTAENTLTNDSNEVATYESSYGDTTTVEGSLDMHIIYDGNTGLLSVKRWNSLGDKEAKMVFRNSTNQTQLFQLFSFSGGVAGGYKTYDAFGRGTTAFTKSNDIKQTSSAFTADQIVFGDGPPAGADSDKSSITNTNTAFYIGANGSLPLFIIADTAPNPNNRTIDYMTTTGTASAIATKQGLAWKPSKTELETIFGVSGFQLFFGGYDIGSGGAFDTSKKARIEFKNLAA